MLADPDLVPFEPPAKPLGLSGSVTLWRNYIEAFPRSAYEQGVTRIRSRLADVLLVCDPQLIKEILLDKADAFGRDPATRRLFTPIIGETSLFLAEGADWRWQRRAVAAIFRNEAVSAFAATFAAHANREVERWRALPRGQPVDAAAAMTHMTFGIIVETLLGGTASLDTARFARALVDVFDTGPWQILLSMLAAPHWTPFPGRRRGERALKFIHREIARVVAARRGRTAARPDLLDLLVAARDPESGRRMTDAEVGANLLSFIAAGHETTALALTWTLWLLAKDQSSQQRVHEEVVAVAGTGEVGAAVVESLTFTRQVLLEAMRLFPPVASLSRQPKAAMQLGGLEIGPRTGVHVPIFALHRNARLWDSPNAFDPDRFAPDRAKARSRFAYLPFGGGTRVCIGLSFALLEATIALATLIRGFHLAPAPGSAPRPVARLTLRPANGLPLSIAPR
jgi:cytochrome P450